LNSNSNTLSIYFQTMSRRACMETSDFTIQPCQSKLTIKKVKEN
jgi:hypothetical protein